MFTRLSSCPIDIAALRGGNGVTFVQVGVTLFAISTCYAHTLQSDLTRSLPVIPLILVLLVYTNDLTGATGERALSSWLPDFFRSTC